MATSKKRIGGLQAILGFAKQEGWITAKVAEGVSISKPRDEPAKPHIRSLKRAS